MIDELALARLRELIPHENRPVSALPWPGAAHDVEYLRALGHVRLEGDGPAITRRVIVTAMGREFLAAQHRREERKQAARRSGLHVPANAGETIQEAV